MPDNRNNKGYYRPEQNRRPQGQNRPQQQESSTWLTPTVKGIIAILLTVLVVAIVIMIFAKTLFVNTNTTPKKTGTITSTEYIPPKTTTTSEKPQETSKKSKKATEPDEDPYDGDKDDNGDAVGDIQCISAVYLHPQPTSSSENLLTIPSGATCKYYRNENGWYYVMAQRATHGRHSSRHHHSNVFYDFLNNAESAAWKYAALSVYIRKKSGGVVLRLRV